MLAPLMKTRMKTRTRPGSCAPTMAAGRLAPMFITALLAACANDAPQHGAGATSGPGAHGADAHVAGAQSAGAGPSVAGATSPGAADGAGAVESASVAWPPHLTEWAEKARAKYDVPTLGAAEAAALPDDAVIVDVREAREVAVSGLPRAMALTGEQTRSEFLRQAAGETVLVYCTVGWRSAQYTQQLVQAGVNAFNLNGGLCAWAAAGRPLVDAQGKPTTAIHAYSKDFADCVPPGFVAVIGDT